MIRLKRWEQVYKQPASLSNKHTIRSLAVNIYQQKNLTSLNIYSCMYK